MKIAIDSRAAEWYRGTGIGTYSFQLINFLNKIDNINEYTLFMSESVKNYIPFNKNFTIKNTLQRNEDNFWNEVSFPNKLTSKNFSLYHVPHNGIGLPHKKNCPFVITLHDIIPYKMPETVSDTYLKIFNKEIPKIISHSDAIITVSQYSKMDIIKAFNYPGKKIYVTYLANEDIYKPLDKNTCKNLIKKYYGINNDFILYIGGFSPRKNIIGLIEAFSLFKSFYKSNIKLVIGGKKGKSFSLYKKRSIDLNIENDVLFTGFIPIKHLPYFYNASKLFVYPSFYEGFGLPPIESMACGTPVITSNRTSIPEILEDAAYFIDPNNIDELCNSMIRVLEDTNFSNLLIKKGFEKSSSLTWKKTAKDTLSAYKKIAKT
ncbi:glycosyltransferase family 4 protein [Haloimpatiens sp. FM7330]|uniref:glycosyltransferase family 4 protein n=1 Tax=Haloimpatiens sp. FM7330 TaxID=3298610 RepID=UPI00362F16DA